MLNKIFYQLYQNRKDRNRINPVRERESEEEWVTISKIWEFRWKVLQDQGRLSRQGDRQSVSALDPGRGSNSASVGTLLRRKAWTGTSWEMCWLLALDSREKMRRWKGEGFSYLVTVASSIVRAVVLCAIKDLYQATHRVLEGADTFAHIHLRLKGFNDSLTMRIQLKTTKTTQQKTN